VVIACAAIGCGNRTSGPPMSVHDSAGVAVVTTPLVGAAPGQPSLQTTPVLDIGGRPADQRYDLVNVTDALRLSDGRVVVAADGTADVRYFDSVGKHLLTIGRRGDGPGEFRGIGHLYHGGGDTVIVYDYQLRRLTTIAPDGTLSPTRPVAALDGHAEIEPIGRLGDGTWIGVSSAFVVHPSSALQRDTIGVVRLNAGLDSVINRIGRFPGTEQYVTMRSHGNRQSLQSIGVPFAAATHVAVTGQTIWVGDAARYEVRAYTPDGSLTRIMRITASRRPVTSADRQRAKDAELAAADSGARQAIARRWEATPAPSQHPAFRTLMVDARHRLWLVESSVVAGDSTPASIFTDDGHGLGRVMLPEHFSASEVGPDYVLGVWSDLDDVQHVRLYRLSYASAERRVRP
jgi:hypothetical protein